MFYMKIKILKDEKEKLKIELDNQTVAEVVREYLNKDDKVKLAVWKREHSSKPVILEIRTPGKTAKKALQDAISNIQKDSVGFSNEMKKAK